MKPGLNPGNIRPGIRPGLMIRSQLLQKNTGYRSGLRAGYAQAYSPSSTVEKISPFLAIFILLAWAVGIKAGFQTSITILTITGFFLAIIGIFFPTPGILGMGMLATLDAATRNFILTGGLLRWNTLNYWLVVVILLNLVNLLRLANLQTRLLQIFIALLAVELLISSSITNGIQDVLNILSAFGLLVYFARGVKIKGGLYWMAILSGLISAAGGAVYFMQITQLPYVNPNSWTFFPLTGIFAICLGYPSSKDHRLGNLILILLAAINFLWIFLSGSRGSMLVGVLCLLFLFLWTRKLTWRVAFLGAAWLALGVLSVIFIDQQAYASERIQKLFDPQYSLAQRTSGRAEIAQTGLQIFIDNPLGVGTGSFRDTAADPTYADTQVAAHSGWVKILSENGIPGILILAAFVFSFLYTGIKRRDRDLFLLGMLVTASFAAALLAKEFQGKGLWFFAAGAITLLHQDEVVSAFAQRTRLSLQSQVTRLRNPQNNRFNR